MVKLAKEKKLAPLEKKISADIVKLLKSEGFLVYVTTGGFYGNNGVADVLAWKRGKAYAFEVKRKPGMKPTPLQQSWLDDALEHGVIAECVGSAEEVEEVVNYFSI